jgi:hypothetical protein
MDGNLANVSNNRTWADVVNNGSAQASSEAESTGATQTIGPFGRADPSRNMTELRYAAPHNRLQNTHWGVANNSILEDPHANDRNPFAGFSLEYLSLKSDYSIRLGGEQTELKQSVPVFTSAHPSFAAILHLSNVLASTLDNDPSTALRQTLGLSRGEFLVIPLDSALPELDAEYITRARFSLQHLANMAETGQYPIRFSQHGEVSPPGVMAEHLRAQVQARDQLSGFWLTFSHYAECCDYDDKSEFIQSQMSPLMGQYLSYAQRPALQEAMGQLGRFFAAVFQTADFNQLENRSVLLQQLMDIYAAACADEFLLETLAQEARENMTNCADRRALILGDMEMAVLMHQSHGMGSEALFETGLSIMRVHIADEHAFKAAQSDKEDETIEVLLRFRTALSDYGLAVTGQAMAHQAVAQIDQDEIDRAADDIEARTRDLAQVQDFFNHCAPWMEHVESMGSPELSRLSDTAQQNMADLHERRHLLSDQQYVQACDTLMHRWQDDKSQLLKQLSDQIVTTLLADYWRYSD